MLKHGSEKDTYFMVMIPASDDEVSEWTKTLKSKPAVINLGSHKLIPLQLEAKAEIGSVEKKLYNPDASGWTSTIGLMRYK